MLAIGPDTPQALQPVLRSIIDEINALKAPGKPLQLASTTFAKLPPAADWRNCHIVVSDKNCIAVSTPSGSTWAWTRSDGSAL